MKLLIDMNLSPRWVSVLGDAGIDSVHWSALGAHDATDSQIMAYARANDYVVLTHDLDFSTPYEGSIRCYTLWGSFAA